MMKRPIILPDHFILGLVIIKKRLMIKKALITLMLCRGDIGRTFVCFIPTKQSFPLPIECLLTQSVLLPHQRRYDTSVEVNVSIFLVCYVGENGFSCGMWSCLDNLSLILPAIQFVTLQMKRWM